MEDLVMCDDIFFDHIDDLLDFPNDDDLAAMSFMVDPHPPITHHHVDVPPPAISPPLPNETPLLVPPHDDAATATATATATDDKVFDNLDIADIEWFSSFIYDPTDSSSLAFPTPEVEVDVNHGGDKINGDDMTTENKYNRTSPDSVLETNSLSNCGFSSSSSSSSCSVDNNGGGRSISERRPALSPYASTYVVVPPTGGRSRYKRPRTTTFSPRTNINASFIPPPPPADQATVAGPKGFDESTTSAPLTMMMTTNITNPASKKKKFNRKNPDDAEESPTAVRKCTHCQIQKTPQWRAGPTGPKTLCNACGVRYKSGRLFPEYRPAASPTFVTAVHSNSHKKVVEMRLKAPVPSPESCDLLEYIRRRE